MTDIRKDFEKFRDEILPNAGAVIHEIAFAAYQAGRTHDVDGLIAEIEANKSTLPHIDGYNYLRNNMIDEFITIIRKHFGKE